LIEGLAELIVNAAPDGSPLERLALGMQPDLQDAVAPFE
jgi:hypothetical protein